MAFNVKFHPLVCAVALFCAADVARAVGDDGDYYVAPWGSDAAAGTQAQPFATLDRTRQAVAARIAAGLSGDLRVYLRGGRYEIAAPVVFGIADSPPAAFRIHYAAFPGERPVISGGRRIHGWTADPDGSWSVDLPEAESGTWRFRELFVNGRRAVRARHPNDGFLRAAGPVPLAPPGNRSNFLVYDGELPQTTSLAGAELVFMHDFSISRVRIAQVNHATDILSTSEPIGATGLINSLFQYESHPRYAVENDAALLDAPGEWYLDPSTGVLRYRPRAGEFVETAEIIAPIATELLVVRGQFQNGPPVRNLSFVGLAFEHCAWGLPPGGYAEYQAGYYEQRQPGHYDLPAAITWELADGCTFEAGRIAHCGGWGILVGAWCTNCRVEGSIVADIAGNGIMVGEDRYRQVPGGQWWNVRPDQVARDNRIESCLIQDCGATLYGCVPLWAGITNGSHLTNNRVRRHPYTGISIGGFWNSDESPAMSNEIAGNRIDDVLNLLSDGGGIYTVGFQPGSTIARNRIHDIPVQSGLSECNGIFLDEGSSGFTLSDNGIHDVAKACMRFHRAGANALVGNTLRLSGQPGGIAYKYQDTPLGNISIVNDLVINPAAPPPCADPVCDEALDAGIAPAFVPIIFADSDSDGLPDVDDPCPTRAPGDLSGDGRINGADVGLIVSLLEGRLPDSSAYCAADLNGDGVATGADIETFVTRLLQIVP